MKFRLRGLGGECVTGRNRPMVHSERAVSPEAALPKAVHLFYQRMCQQLHSSKLYFLPGGVTHSTKKQRKG